MNIVVTGIDETIAKLEKAKDIDKPIKEGIYQVMQEAERIVLTKYSLQGNGNDDYVTSIEEIPNGYMLTASGEDVGFLEFGAGVFTEAMSLQMKSVILLHLGRGVNHIRILKTLTHVMERRMVFGGGATYVTQA